MKWVGVNVVTYLEGGVGDRIKSKSCKIGRRDLSSLIRLSAGINPCWQAVVKPRGGISVNNNVSLIRKYLIGIASDPFVYTFSQASSGRK